MARLVMEELQLRGAGQHLRGQAGAGMHEESSLIDSSALSNGNPWAMKADGLVARMPA